MVIAGTGSGDVELCYLPPTIGPRDNLVSRGRKAPVTDCEGLDPLPPQSPASKTHWKGAQGQIYGQEVISAKESPVKRTEPESLRAGMW